MGIALKSQIPSSDNNINLTQDGSLNRRLSPPKLKNMQLQGGSIYIAKEGPFLIGGGTGAKITGQNQMLGCHKNNEMIDCGYRIVIYYHSEESVMQTEDGCLSFSQGRVDTHGLTPVALAAEDYFVLPEGFHTLRLPRKVRLHLRADVRSPRALY